MFRALLKKQLMEVCMGMIRSKRNGKVRSKDGIVTMIILYAVLFLCFGFTFFAMANSICVPMVTKGYAWLYFCWMGLIAVTIGVFGSIFNAYSSLYKAKDNEMLLSMPIPPSYILTVRLLGVWMWSFLFEAVVFFPALLSFWSHWGEWEQDMFCGSPVLAVIFQLLMLVLISVLVLTISCVLGWLLAKASVKMKNKTVVIVLLSLAFMAVYYWGYFKAYTALQNIVANMETVGSSIRGSLYPLYLFGRAAVGDVIAMISVACVVLALFGAVHLVLARTFLKLVTANRGEAKKAYRETAAKQRGAYGALLWKEWKRFTTSPVYLLNCGMGMLLMPIGGIILLVKADAVREIFALYPAEAPELLLMAACVALCTSSALNDITAPSVSLEGKNLWLAQSLPVTPWQVLLAKVGLHVLCTGVSMSFFAVCCILVIKPGILGGLLLFVVPLLYILFCASGGLAVNLKMPNLNWTNETVPIKQSVAVLAVMLGGMFCIAVLAGIYMVVQSLVPAVGYLVFCGIVFAGVDALLLLWLKRRGTEILEEL